MVSKKMKKRRLSACSRKLENGEICSGKYELSYLEQVPIFTCSSCGHIDESWKNFYTEYLQLFKVKENWDNKKHQISCIIGFFCYMYKKYYNVDYIFVPKTLNPFSSKECRDSWMLLSAFSGDAHMVRKYIHWFFNAFITDRNKVFSFGYINTPAIIRKFNLYYSTRSVLKRESQLPQNFTNWCVENAKEIFSKYSLSTMNDLGALLSHYTFYRKNISDGDVEFLVIDAAKKMNLILNDKLNVG